MEFSDDEKEAEHKRLKKSKSHPETDFSLASSGRTKMKNKNVKRPRQMNHSSSQQSYLSQPSQPSPLSTYPPIGMNYNTGTMQMDPSQYYYYQQQMFYQQQQHQWMYYNSFPSNQMNSNTMSMSNGNVNVNANANEYPYYPPSSTSEGDSQIQGNQHSKQSHQNQE